MDEQSIFYSQLKSLGISGTLSFDQSLERMQKDRKILFIVVAVAAIIRGVYFSQISRTPFFPPLILDPFSYHTWAQNILKNGWIGNEIFYQSPLYPYFLAIFYRIFQDNIIAPRIFQTILGISIPVLIYLISIQYFSRSVSLLSAFIATFYSPLFFKDPLGDKTPLAIFLTTLTMFLIVRTMKTSPRNNTAVPLPNLWLLTGIMIGMTAMVRENILLCAAALLIFLLINKRLKSAILILTGAIIVIAPVTIRNYMVEKDFVLLTSQGGENFYIGNNPRAPGTYKAPHFVRPQPKYEKEDFFKHAEKETHTKLKPSQVSNFYFAKSLQFIKQNPLQYIKLLGRKLFLFWNRYEIPDNYNYYFLKLFVPILRFPFLTFSIISPLSILGLAIGICARGTSASGEKEWRKYIVLYIAIFSYMVGIVLFFVVGRYRIPILPLLIPFASYAIVTSIKNKYYLTIPAFLFLLIITNIPLSVFSIHYKFSTEYYMLGYAYEKMGNLREAAKAWEKTLKIDKNYEPAIYHLKKAKGILRVNEILRFAQNDSINEPMVLLELADAYRDAGQLDMALQVLYKACKIAPQNPDTHNKLGLFLAMFFDSLEKSLIHFQKARSLAPKRADIRANLGSTYYKLGDTKKAWLEWEESLRLNPNNFVLKRTMEELKRQSIPLKHTKK